jgi:hypothetical protein
MINLLPRDLTNSTSEHLVLISSKKESKQPTQSATAEPVKPEVKIEKPTTKTVEVSSLINESVAVTAAVAKEQEQTNQNKVTKSAKAEESTVEQQITNNLRSWANAWSNKDYKGYIATYTNVYRPNAKLTHKQWVQQREHRIAKPKFIKVSISNIKVKLLQDNLAEALFEQRYQSDTYKDAVKKRVMLVNSNGQWKISLEKSLGHI